MTENEYNKHSGVRRSDLWKINESPEKYKYALEHPIETTPAMAFGSAAHKLILEGYDAFNAEYAVAPQFDKRTKAGKEDWEKFCAENADKEIVSLDDYKVLTDMHDQISSCNLAYVLLNIEGETETPFFWIDKDTGEECKVKLDRLVKWDGRYAVLDYKTAASAQTDKFVHEMFKLGYHLQAAMYTEGVMVSKGLDYRPDFIFLVQEKKPPYSVNVVYVAADSGVMTYGIDTFRLLMGTLHQCKETGYFYGYTGAFGEMNDAYLPGYISMGDEE